MSTIRHWARINEGSFVLGMRLLFQLHRCLGRWPFRMVLYPVVAYFYCTRPAQRLASQEYLRHVCQHSGRGPVPRGYTLHHFAAFAETILDKMLAWSGDIAMDQIDFDSEPAARDAVATQCGGVIIIAHLGNLELARVLATHLPGVKLNILVHHIHAQRFNEMLARLNPQSSVNLIEVSDISPATAVNLASRIEAGEFVVIAADRIPVSANAPVVYASFLGQPAPFPAGPWILASILRCPVYLMWNLRVGKRYRVSFEPFRERVSLPRKQRAQATAELAQAYAARLEQMCTLAPLQWFNFFSFWALPADMKYDVLA